MLWELPNNKNGTGQKLLEINLKENIYISEDAFIRFAFFLPPSLNRTLISNRESFILVGLDSGPH